MVLAVTALASLLYSPTIHHVLRTCLLLFPLLMVNGKPKPSKVDKCWLCKSSLLA